MKKILGIFLALVLALSLSLVTAVPAAAASTTTTLEIPDNVYCPAPFDVSSTTANSETVYDNVRFNITVSGSEAFTGVPSDIFTITHLDGSSDTQGINETFILVDGDFIGGWGPEVGFILSDPYDITSVFTVQMNTSTAPLGDYEVTVDLVDLTPEPDVTLATATDGFSLSADTLYVGAGQQFTTIQSAIDAADSGDIILVYPGIYYENILIDEALTVKSTDGAEETTIDGIKQYIVWVRHSDVTFEGFTVTNPDKVCPDPSGILVSDPTGGWPKDATIVNNVYILNNIVKAVRSETGNPSTYGATGINIGPSSDVVISGNTIENIKEPGETIHGPCGINVWGTAEVDMPFNITITNNEISGIYSGILLQYASNVLIEDNPMITGCEVGIRVEPFEEGDVSDLMILRNTITDFNKGGIVVKDVNSIQVEGNIISTTDYSVAPNGIQIGYIGAITGTTGTVNDNRISGCHWDGYDPLTQTYEDDWTGSGILVIDTASQLEISGNEVQSCDVGLDIESGTPTLVTNNDVHDNSYGFVLWNADSTINFNNIEGNELCGVYRTTDLTGNLDATMNWWGTTDGSAIAGKVSGDVDFTPWLPASFDQVEEGAVDSADVSGSDTGKVDLKDDGGNTIATVNISGAPGDVAGTIIASRYSEEPEPGGKSLSVGTGATSVVFLDVQVTGYTSGWAHITVPYTKPLPAGVEEDTLGLYYWDEAVNMWRIARNSAVDTTANTVSGDIPVSALTGTPIGLGGYEALVAIESILNLSYSGEDTVKLTIDTNTAFLGAATIDLMFDPRVVEVLSGESSDFDTLTVNLNYAHFGSDTQIARFLAYQETGAGVDATDGAVVAVVKLKANEVASTMDFSSLRLEVITLKDNNLDRIPHTVGAPSFALVGGVGDANRDTYVDFMDVVKIAWAILGLPDHSIDTPTMNVDGKDAVDAADCTYLARHLVGVGGYSLPPSGWIPPWGPWPAPPAP